MELKVGSKVFMFSSNRREYAVINGRMAGPALYRSHFYEVEIDGETSRSWLINSHYSGTVKINKKTLQGVYTAEQVDEECWVHEHKYKIERLINGCSHEQLRQIATILNYKENT